jgi:hypothetical protein
MSRTIKRQLKSLAECRTPRNCDIISRGSYHESVRAVLVFRNYEWAWKRGPLGPDWRLLFPDGSKLTEVF